ncbi:MAG TPA: hypothetical protein VF547_04030 [Allosphingosinicella sp.]
MTSRIATGAGHALVFLAAAAIGLQPLAAQREVVAEGPYLHGPARAVLPVAVGEFRRSRIFQYDAEGKDVSASYDLATPNGRLLITVYIYPAAAAAGESEAVHCRREFEEANKAVSSQHGHVAADERGPAMAVDGIDRALGHRALYRFSSPFDDRVQAIRSEVHLYCYAGGDWLVKYRVSAPAAVETRGPVEAFIRHGPWPGRSSS